MKELNEKLKKHLVWSNHKPMRTLGDKCPLELLREKLPRPKGLGEGCRPDTSDDASAPQPVMYHIENFSP